MAKYGIVCLHTGCPNESIILNEISERLLKSIGKMTTLTI